MFKALTSQLETALDGLTELVQNASSTQPSPSPFLLVHPPSAREDHVTSTRAVGDELATLLLTIQSLETKVKDVRQRVFRQQRRQMFALTAISALPSEILRTIFAFATRNPWSPGRRFISVSSSLSQVCWGWHEVTTSQRALWSDIRLPLPKFNHSAQLLKLSKGDFVKMRLYESPRQTINTEIIRKSQHRLRDLSISCLYAWDAEAVFDRLIPEGRGSFEFTNIESLSLEDDESMSWRHDRRPLTFPNLRHLVLSGTMLLQSIHADQLVSLDIIGPPKYPDFVDGLHDLLNGSLRLQTLTVRHAEDYKPLRLSQKPVVTLEHLRSLQVKELNFLGLADILSRFIAPDLEVFVAEVITPTVDYELADTENNDDDLEELGQNNLTWEEYFRFQARKTVRNIIRSE